MRCIFTVCVILGLLTPLRAQAACGDCNGDGSVSVLDGLEAAQISVQISSPSAAQLCACDVDDDGTIDIVDALILAQAAAGLPVTLMCSSSPCPGASGGCPLVEGVLTGLPLPIQLTGDTTGASGETRLTCGLGPAHGMTPDHIYEWSPPQSTTYTFALCNSAFDTQFEIREADCTMGNVLACNDDDCATRSRISNLSLQAGVTYYIVIQGWAGSYGYYELDISTP